MEKLQRQTQKIFGGNAPADDIAVLGSFKSGSPVYTDDINTLQNEAYEKGYSAALIADEAPMLEEQNSVPYVLSKQLAYLFQTGIPEWDAQTTYFANTGICQVNGIIYKSLTDDNIGNNPTNDTTNWTEYNIDGANTSLSNLTSDGEKHFLNKTQITNCVLEVPQDIKYEITSDGKIILKAGSRVYVSTNGTFEAVTLTSDTAAAAGGLWTSDNSRKVFVVYMPHSNAVISQPVDYTFSQASAPTSFVGSSALWYDTTNRVLKCTWNNGANWYICSLPIMIGRPGIISSGKSGWAGVVDNVFNGMGFFGSTVWVGKGVKGLAPNRRNADGTLRNNLVVSKSVNFYTNDNYTTSRTTFVLFHDASVGRVTGGRYDASRNINENSVGNDLIFCPIAEGSLSSGRITSFTPLQCFQVADAQNITQKCSPAWANRFTMGLPKKPTSATTDTFICPDNGIIVIDAYKDTNSGTIYVYVNGIMMFAAPAYNATGFAICFPVTRGDSIKLVTDQTATGWTVRRDDFVPYIGGY